MRILAAGVLALLLFRASLDWLTAGSVNGMKDGTLRLGY